MIYAKKILSVLPDVLKEIEIPNLGKKYQGKVRDFYIVDKKRITITTDRQSAFDVVLGYIPYKGAVLNSLAAFWFNKTKHIIPNHMITLPDPNVLVSKQCEIIPIEMVVRGYLSGVTKTSVWHSYEKGEREIYGIKFPNGMKKNQKLPSPIITPTTHPEAGSNLHDERLTRDEIINKKIVPKKLYEQMEKAALDLFAFGSKWCEKHGLILVDTKYEFGLVNGELTLIDEIHTPDSSRFWLKESYKKRFAKGIEPENFDKEFLRLWYAARGYKGDGTPPQMSKELIIQTSQRYIAVFEKITGEKFKSFQYPIENRIKKNLQDTLLHDNKNKSLQTKKITYSQTGVNYDVMDPVKRLAQMKAKATANNLAKFGMHEVGASRGESAYVWEEKDAYRAFVIEGLGTKNMVADELRKKSKRTYYDALAQDTVAMIINDLIVVGAQPQVINAYFAVGSSDWFEDEERSKDLINGWAKACELSGAVWGGGETPTLKGIVDPQTIELAGSAIGIINPKSRLVLGDKLQAGDAIIFIESSGIHANGLTLARTIATQLPNGYKTRLSNGMQYGEALLQPTHIYASLVNHLFENNINIHYMVNVTGHGWRKLMRANADFSYIINTVPTPQPLFDFIQKHSGNDDKEMYGNFNMGVGFALFINKNQIAETLAIAKKNKMKAWHAGYVETGERQVVITPKQIVFKGEQLQVRM